MASTARPCCRGWRRCGCCRQTTAGCPLGVAAGSGAEAPVAGNGSGAARGSRGRAGFAAARPARTGSGSGGSGPGTQRGGERCAIPAPPSQRRQGCPSIPSPSPRGCPSIPSPAPHNCPSISAPSSQGSLSFSRTQTGCSHRALRPGWGHWPSCPTSQEILLKQPQ